MLRRAEDSVTPVGTARGEQHPNVEALVHADRHIMIGTVKQLNSQQSPATAIERQQYGDATRVSQLARSWIG